MIEDFATGSAGLATEPGVIQVMEATVPLGNVRRRRSSRAQELVAHPVAFILRQPGNDFAGNEKAERATRLPTFQILKTANWGSNFHFGTLPNHQRSPPSPITNNQSPITRRFGGLPHRPFPHSTL